MYQILCVATDKAITALEKQKGIFLAAEILKAALLEAEDVYINTEENQYPSCDEAGEGQAPPLR